MISNNKTIIQTVVLKDTHKYLKKLSKNYNTSISVISKRLLENQILQLNKLKDKDFLEVLNKLFKEFQNENN